MNLDFMEIFDNISSSLSDCVSFLCYSLNSLNEVVFNQEVDTINDSIVREIRSIHNA
jgi:hypothetical protein